MRYVISEIGHISFVSDLSMVVMFSALLVISIFTATSTEGLCSSQDIADCLHEILKNYFHTKSLQILASFESEFYLGNANINRGAGIRVSNNYEDDNMIMKNLIKTMSNLSKSNLEITIMHKNYQSDAFGNKDEAYVMVIGAIDGKSLPGVLKELISKRRLKFNTKALNLLICLVSKSLGNNGALLKNVFHVLWSFHIYNVVLATVSNSSHRPNVELHTWFPYRLPGICGRSANDTVLLNRYFCDSGSFYIPRTQLFLDKVPEYFDKCPFIVAAGAFPPYVMEPSGQGEQIHYGHGMEINMLYLVGEKLDLRLIFRDQRKDGVGIYNYTTRSWTGAFAELITRKSDIASMGIVLIDDWKYSFDFTVPYYTEEYHWVVPVAKHIPHWTSIANVFSSSMQMLILASILFVSTFSALTAQLLSKAMVANEKSFITKLNETILQHFSTLLGIAVSSLPRASTLRVMFTFWLFYSLLVSSAFQSFLISVLTNPGYEHQIDSEEEILSQGLELSYHLVFDRYFNDNTANGDAILQRRNVLTSLGTSLETVVKKRDFASVTSRTVVKYLGMKHMDDRGKYLFHSLSENVVTLCIVSMMLKGHPLRDAVSVVIARIQEHGFLAKFRADPLYEMRLKCEYNATRLGRNTAIQSLKVNDLQGAIFILLLGLSLSVLTFASEFAVARYVLWRGKIMSTKGQERTQCMWLNQKVLTDKNNS